MKKPNSKLLDKNLFNDWIFDVIDDYSNRYEIYYGGAGSGKSYAAISKLILKCCGNPRKVLIIRKVASSLKDSVYSLFCEVLANAMPGIGMKYIIYKSSMNITFENGSEFIFKGLDDPEKIKSINGITDIFIEEATEITFDDFTQLNLRLRPKVSNPQIYLLFNPVSKANWCYTKWFETKNDALIIHSTYKQNKFLNDEYRDVLEKLIETNPAYYRIYCLGEFGSLDKLVFPKIYKEIISDKSYLPKFVGLDFGYINDPTAIIWGYIDESDRKIYITGEFCKKGMLNDEIADVLIKLGLHNDIIIADCAERKSIDELRKCGIRKIRPAFKGAGSILDGVNKLLAYKIFVDSRLINIISEFDNYTWIRNSCGEFINTPIDKYNHLIDALRYGVQSVITKNTMRILK